MPNRRYNTQVANPMKSGGRVKRMGGGMTKKTKYMSKKNGGTLSGMARRRNAMRGN